MSKKKVVDFPNTKKGSKLPEERPSLDDIASIMEQDDHNITKAIASEISNNFRFVHVLRHEREFFENAMQNLFIALGDLEDCGMPYIASKSFEEGVRILAAYTIAAAAVATQIEQTEENNDQGEE